MYLSVLSICLFYLSSHSLSVFLSIILFFSVYICLVCLSVSVSFCLSVSLYIFFCLSIFCLSICLLSSIYISLSFCLFVYHFFISICLFISLFLFLFVCLSLSIQPSCFFFIFHLSLYLSICHLSIYVSTIALTLHVILILSLFFIIHCFLQLVIWRLNVVILSVWIRGRTLFWMWAAPALRRVKKRNRKLSVKRRSSAAAIQKVLSSLQTSNALLLLSQFFLLFVHTYISNIKTCKRCYWGIQVMNRALWMRNFLIHQKTYNSKSLENIVINKKHLLSHGFTLKTTQIHVRIKAFYLSLYFQVPWSYVFYIF